MHYRGMVMLDFFYMGFPELWGTRSENFKMSPAGFKTAIICSESWLILYVITFYISTTWRVPLLMTRESLRAHVAKFYNQLWLIRSVLRAIKLFCVKIDWILFNFEFFNFVGLLHHPFWLLLVSVLFNFWNYFVWLKITDDGSEPGMRIWSIL